MNLAKWPARLLLALAAATGALSLTASAQAYPVRPVRLLVPAPPGGGTDLLGRMVAQKLAGTLRQQFIVDNRAGASGMIASEIVARADPDGQTLLISFTTHATNPGLFPKMPYDTTRDFSAVAMVGMIPSVLVLHPSLPPQSVKAFIAYAKERPGKLIYGSAGSGSGTHLSAVLFSSMTGTSMVHVPYKGAAPAVVDLLAGQLNFMFGNMASVMPHVNSGKLRALAVTGAKRSATAPDLPTIAETGLPGYEATAWFALFAPARTPAVIVNTLNREVNALFNQADVKERMLSLGADAHPMTPADLGRFVETEIVKWGKLIKATGAKAD
jgi:tripartite-type tricarboxylate transporter receptor subunit TctC